LFRSLKYSIKPPFIVPESKIFYRASFYCSGGWTRQNYSIQRPFIVPDSEIFYRASFYFSGV
jgi:hypothetical protein